jgi:hypothetical protein
VRGAQAESFWPAQAADKVVCMRVARGVRACVGSLPLLTGVHARWRTHVHALGGVAATREDRTAMDIVRARVIAERLHADHREANGIPLLNHIRRVVALVPADAQVVAWLHEVLEWTAVAEAELLMEGLESDELRALRLVHRADDARSDRVYLAHLHLIACAAGDAGRLARLVKTADLRDRCLHPRRRADGWSPPYARALAFLMDHRDPWQAAAV